MDGRPAAKPAALDPRTAVTDVWCKRTAPESEIRSSIRVPAGDRAGLIGWFLLQPDDGMPFPRGSVRAPVGHRDVMRLPIDSCDSTNHSWDDAMITMTRAAPERRINRGCRGR